MASEERFRLERELFSKVQQTQREYKIAAAEYNQRNEDIKSDEGVNTDRWTAFCQAGERERVALERYKRALRAFTDLVVYKQPPITNTH